jgi:hypothetical protein
VSSRPALTTCHCGHRAIAVGGGAMVALEGEGVSIGKKANRARYLGCKRGSLSPPASSIGWTDWSYTWGGEMCLRRALEKLNLEYPCDSDD